MAARDSGKAREERPVASCATHPAGGSGKRVPSVFRAGGSRRLKPHRYAVVVAVVSISCFACRQAVAGEAAGKQDGGSHAAADGRGAAVSVTAEPLRVRSVQRTVQVVGSFAGYEEVTVMAEVSGRVIQILHDVGDIVRPGDVLLRIDPTDYELALQEMRRSLELDATRIGAPIPPEDKFKPDLLLPLVEKFNIEELPSIKRVNEQERNAKKKLERAQQLIAQNSISKELFEQAQTDYVVANNTTTQTYLDARAVLAALKLRLVQLRIAEEKLRRTAVVVPTPTPHEALPKEVEYSVAQRRVSEGEMVKDSSGASMSAFDLVLDKVLKFNASVPERYVDEVKKDQRVELQVDAFPGRKFPGKILRISPVVDRLSRTFQVEVIVPNAERALRPGGFAKGDVLTRVDSEAITAPRAAVYTFVGTARVFAVHDGKVRMVPVSPGVESPATSAEPDGWIELVNADRAVLSPGTLVVTTGHSQLSDGTPVVLRQTESAERPPATSRGGEAQR